MTELIEIGSEFWSVEHGTQKEIRNKLFLSGRTALASIIIDLKKRGIKEVCLPDYCCHSMIEPFARQDMCISYYSVSRDQTGLSFEIRNRSEETIMLVDYFGFMSDKMKEMVDFVQGEGKSVILDQTQALLSWENDFGADYAFGSYRKWTGLEAGFASGKKQDSLETWDCSEYGARYLELRNQARTIKKEFVSQGYQDESLRNDQLRLFHKAEELLDSEYLSDTDDTNKHLVASLDVAFIKNQRKLNAATIYERLQHLRYCKPLFPVLPEQTVPMAVPILVSKGKRDSLRNYLRDSGVFCPIHWPKSPLLINVEGASELYDNELSLVCDQRYDESDMVHMMEIVKQWETTEFA